MNCKYEGDPSRCTVCQKPAALDRRGRPAVRNCSGAPSPNAVIHDRRSRFAPPAWPPFPRCSWLPLPTEFEIEVGPAPILAEHPDCLLEGAYVVQPLADAFVASTLPEFARRAVDSLNWPDAWHYAIALGDENPAGRPFPVLVLSARQQAHEVELQATYLVCQENQVVAVAVEYMGYLPLREVECLHTITMVQKRAAILVAGFAWTNGAPPAAIEVAGHNPLNAPLAVAAGV